MAIIDCSACGAEHDIAVDPDRPFEHVECACGADLTDIANTAWAMVRRLLDRSSAALAPDDASLGRHTGSEALGSPQSPPSQPEEGQ